MAKVAIADSEQSLLANLSAIVELVKTDLASPSSHTSDQCDVLVVAEELVWGSSRFPWASIERIFFYENEPATEPCEYLQNLLSNQVVNVGLFCLS
jgi:hypothetical protein